jgi:hypothetical protein
VATVTNQPHQFKHRDIVRAFRAAEAAGVPNPTVQIRCRDGTEITVGGKPGEAAAIPKKAKLQPAAAVKPKTFVQPYWRIADDRKAQAKKPD